MIFHVHNDQGILSTLKGDNFFLEKGLYEHL